jgi:hypothetical protein
MKDQLKTYLTKIQSVPDSLMIEFALVYSVNKELIVIYYF